ncbi:MAG TPA: hypothetical protein PKH93_00160 [Chitinophagales bacterium]|nr:hypothetical protein [Chitinophagales bacterium]
MFFYCRSIVTIPLNNAFVKIIIGYHSGISNQQNTTVSFWLNSSIIIHCLFGAFPAGRAVLGFASLGASQATHWLTPPATSLTRFATRTSEMILC